MIILRFCITGGSKHNAVVAASAQPRRFTPEGKLGARSEFDLDIGMTYVDGEPLGTVRVMPLYREPYLLLTPGDGELAGRDSIDTDRGASMVVNSPHQSPPSAIRRTYYSQEIRHGQGALRSERGDDDPVVKLHYTDKFRLPPEVEEELGLTFHESAANMVPHRDVVTNAPLHPETEGKVNDELLSTMKRGSYLINTARARIWDEGAIVRALESGHLAGYAGDIQARTHPR